MEEERSGAREVSEKVNSKTTTLDLLLAPGIGNHHISGDVARLMDNYAPFFLFFQVLFFRRSKFILSFILFEAELTFIGILDNL